MKTQKRTPIVSALGTLSLIIMLAFSINSCQKDDLTTTGNSSSNGTDQSLGKSVANTLPYLGPALIRIDHLAGMTQEPDFSVTLYNNGAIVFEGRRNVSLIGQARLAAKFETIVTVKKLITASEFFNMKVKTTNVLDAAKTITTCSMKQSAATDASFSAKTRSLIDYNNGYPRDLYTLRTEIEKLLDIQKFIGK